MLLQLAEHERLLGRRPEGYRSPAWDFSDATLGLLEELGFVWDSSLMGRDFEVYRPRPVVTVTGSGAAPSARPVRSSRSPSRGTSMHFPFLEQLPRGGPLGSVEVLYAR